MQATAKESRELPVYNRAEAGEVNTLTIVAKIALVMLLPLAGSAGCGLLYVLLAVWAVFGPRRAIEALTLSWLATCLNPGVYPAISETGALRWLVHAAAFISIAFATVRRGVRVPCTWIWLVIFVITAATLGVIESYALEVSLLKLVSFFIGMTVIIMGFHFTRGEARYWQKWVFGLFATVTLAGFVLIVHPVGYFINGSGFQGILSHPQTYTLFLGPLFAWHVARLLTGEIRGPWMWVLAVIAGVSLWATEGRTGAVAAAGGLAVAGGWWLVSWQTRFRIRRSLVAVGLLVLALGGAAIGARWQEVAEGITRFILKSGSVTSLGEAFYQSRGFLIERAITNFLQHPLTGIGFGLPSDPAMLRVETDPFFGLPVNAPVEKGFAFAALLEEVGIVGSVVFFLFLGVMLRPTMLRGAPFSAMTLAVSTILLNFGEAVLFALGGSGVLVWLLIGTSRVSCMRVNSNRL